MTRCVILMLLVTGCATVPVAPTVLLNPAKYVEARDLPPDPALEALPPETPKGEWVEALEAGACADSSGKALSGAPKPCPARSGLLVSEERLARDLLFRTRYTELRRVFEADRIIWSAHRELYEARIRQTEEALNKAQPNWFQQNALQIGVVGGFIIGAAMTIAITYAVEQVTTPSP